MESVSAQKAFVYRDLVSNGVVSSRLPLGGVLSCLRIVFYFRRALLDLRSGSSQTKTISLIQNSDFGEGRQQQKIQIWCFTQNSKGMLHQKGLYHWPLKYIKNSGGWSAFCASWKTWLSWKLHWNHLFTKHLLNAYYLWDPSLGTWIIKMNKTRSLPESSWGRAEIHRK